MKLLDWMRREGVDDDGMASRVNDGLSLDDHITVSAVKKWKYGERQPPADKIVRIEEVTGGEVTLRDLLLPPPNDPLRTVLDLPPEPAKAS